MRPVVHAARRQREETKSMATVGGRARPSFSGGSWPALLQVRDGGGEAAQGTSMAYSNCQSIYEL